MRALYGEATLCYLIFQRYLLALLLLYTVLAVITQLPSFIHDVSLNNSIESGVRNVDFTSWYHLVSSLVITVASIYAMDHFKSNVLLNTCAFCSKSETVFVSRIPKVLLQGDPQLLFRWLVQNLDINQDCLVHLAIDTSKVYALCKERDVALEVMKKSARDTRTSTRTCFGLFDRNPSRPLALKYFENRLWRLDSDISDHLDPSQVLDTIFLRMQTFSDANDLVTRARMSKTNLLIGFAPVNPSGIRMIFDCISKC